MSIRLMTVVWDIDLPPGEKLVLLALADQANDQGTQCWPSVETIAHRSGQGVRTVRRALASLEKAGHLTRKHRDGTSTQYHVHPGQNGSPAKQAPLPKTTKTPAKLAPKPSGTVNGLSNDKPKRVRKPEGVDRQSWDDWKAARKGAPITQSVMDTVKQEAAKLGWSVPEAIAHAAGNSWRGFKADWVKDRKPANDYRNGNSNSNAADLARQKLGLG